MNEHQILKKENKNIPRTLLQSKYLLEVLYELSDGEAKSATLIEILSKNIRKSFHRIEKCRKLIRYKQFK